MTDLVISTKERPGSYDAIETAKPDEPLFPLQGGDPFAPPTILHWVDLARREGMRLTGDHPEGSKEHERGVHLLEKATMAEQVAWAFQDYQRGHQPVPEARAHYQDQGPSVPELDAARSRREAMIAGSARLHNSLAEAVSVADKLDELGVQPEQAAQIRDAAATLKEAAFAIEPRRENERS